MSRAILVVLVSLLLMLHASTAAAFCGLYVSQAGDKLFNDATRVVLMREHNRTILSMQNNYKGPPKDFALGAGRAGTFKVQGAVASKRNQFQARYIMLYPSPVKPPRQCKRLQRASWRGRGNAQPAPPARKRKRRTMRLEKLVRGAKIPGLSRKR